MGSGAQAPCGGLRKGLDPTRMGNGASGKAGTRVPDLPTAAGGAGSKSKFFTPMMARRHFEATPKLEAPKARREASES